MDKEEIASLNGVAVVLVNGTFENGSGTLAGKKALKEVKIVKKFTSEIRRVSNYEAEK